VCCQQKISASIKVCQACQEGTVGGKLPQTKQRLAGPAIAPKIKYTRMHRLKKNPKKFFPSGPHCGSRWAWQSASWQAWQFISILSVAL